jgi:PadR family transcriptional regulator, regulatory protein PadR
VTDPLLKHFYGGFIRLHVLYHAGKEPIFGLEMIEELGRHGYRIGPGTLYPILHQLERDGYLKRTDQMVGGRRRKTYRATAAGRRLLDDAKAKLRELFSEVIENRTPKPKRSSR